VKLYSGTTCTKPWTRRLSQVWRFAHAVRAIPYALAGVALLVTNGARALPNDDLSFPHAKTPTFLWSEKIDIQVSGVPVVVRGFVADMTLEDAARLMARHRRHFQRVTTLPGSILLSGVHEGRHWVAQLDAGAGRIKGMVSALPLDVKNASPHRNAGVLSPWLTHNASHVFTQSSRIGNRNVNHSVYRHDGSLDRFLGALDTHLQRSGWYQAAARSWVQNQPGTTDSPRRVDVHPVSTMSNGFVFISQSG